MTAVHDLPPTKLYATPTVGSSAAPSTPAAKAHSSPNVGAPQVLNVLPGQLAGGAHLTTAGEAQTTRPTDVAPMPSHSASDGSSQRVVQGQTTSGTRARPALDDPLLYLAAVSLDDLERTRIAAENRLRQLTRNEPDADGEERGFGLTTDNPQVRAQQSIVDGLTAMEHGAELALKRRLRQHPLHGWIKTTVGVGEKQAARLLAAVGDPYWNTLHDRPRTVSELWAYAGYKVIPADRPTFDAQLERVGGEQSDGDPGRGESETQGVFAGVAVRRKKGQRANWSTVAKMRAYIIAEKCLMFDGKPDKNGKPRPLSPYRAVYDNRREHTATTHPEWTAGHSHNDALRIVAKELLKDLWRAAQQVHQSTGSPAAGDAAPATGGKDTR